MGTWGEVDFVIVALFWFLFACVSAFLASNRAKNSLFWFAMGLLFGPFAFVGAIWPRRKEKDPNRRSQ
jgi:uncharacterized RDD family membrane protein YckC